MKYGKSRGRAKKLLVKVVVLARLDELVLPLYILHQSAIDAIAFYVVSLDLLVIEEFLLIALTSFPFMLALLYPITSQCALNPI